MKFTDHFRLGSMEPNQPIIPLEDSRRMLTIDRQMLGLFQVLGNGVISGWTVTSGTALSVNISPGRGHVFFMSALTQDPRSVPDLVPSQTNYIYAQALETTRFDRNVFFFSSTNLFNSSQAILLAAVITDASSIVSVDNSVRQDISFIEQIKTLINQHRHRGAPDNPTKIDLASEVQGQLPGSRVDGFDAAKIITGTIAPGRLPPIEHASLKNSGILTHPQLETFIRNLSNPNVRLLGELSTVNMLQMYLAHKHIWNEVDAFSFNILAMIPGITPDSYTDFSTRDGQPVTTAIFDRSNHVIQGVPSTTGTLLTTTFQTRLDFESAFSNSNLDIVEQAGDVFLRLERPFGETEIESFDSVLAAGLDVPNWTVETVSTADSTSYTTDGDKKVDGAYSADLTIDQAFRVQATKIFGSSDTLDWSNYNKLEISIYTLSANHGRINMQILGGTADNIIIIDDFTVLEAAEITEGGFAQFTRPIDTLTRDAVLGIRFYTETGSGWDLGKISFNVDRIRLINDLFFVPAGRMRFRLKTPQKSQWAAISWDADLNGGTVQARARSVADFAVLDQSTAIPFKPFFSASGDNPQVEDNTNLEIEIAVGANGLKTASPVVRSVTVSYITPSTSRGFRIDTADEFARGTLVNTEILSTPAVSPLPDDGDVAIEGRIEVGDYIYSTNYTIQQIYKDALTNRVTPYKGVSGDRLPLSPVQAARTDVVFRNTGFDGVASVERLEDRTYLVCDTLNDRVLIMDQEGNVLSGIASNNARDASSGGDSSLYPLTASLNLDDSTLYINWSTNTFLSKIDVTKITINGAGLNLTLSGLDSVVRPTGLNAELDSSNIVPIKLSDAHSGEIQQYINNSGIADTRLYLNVDPGVVKDTTGAVDLENTNFATLTSPRGLPIFVGNVKYIKGLFWPLSAEVTSAENWLIGNAKPILTNDDGTDVRTGVGKSEITTVVEVNPDTGEIVFSDDSVDFSILTLGGVIEMNERFVVEAGIVKDENPPSNATSTSFVVTKLGIGTVASESTTTVTTTEKESNAEANTDTTTITNSKSDFSELSGYRGVVKIIEKSSGRVVFEQPTSDGTYASDVQIDSGMNLVVIEKSFASDGTGRGRVVKMDDLGNVYFQWGLSEFSCPNDVRVLSNDNMVISS